MRWLLVDGFNLVFRSHFAMERSNLRRQSDQFPTGALHGWIKSLQDLRDAEKPDRCVVFFDLGGSDRHLAVLPDYKGQRDDTPPDIILQLPEIKKLTALLGFAVIQERGVDADDLIAAAVQRLAAAGDECIIVSADKDFGQCVGAQVLQLAPPPTANPALGWRRLDAAGVEAKFGVPPTLIADYLALVGDTSDNIPGLKGVGPKTAVKWLQQYGGLEDRPRVVVLNKIDIPEGRELAEFVLPDLHERGYQVFLVSAVSHEGLRELGFALAEIVKASRAEAIFAAENRPRVIVTPKSVDDSGFTVTAEKSGAETIRYRVVGERPERRIHQTDFANDEAVGYLADRLARAGIELELAKAGAVAGDEVVIGEGPSAVVFDWAPTAGDLHQGPRGTDQRLYDKRRLSAEERLAIHRIRQYGTGEPEETVGEMVDALIIEDFDEDLESEDLN